MEKGKSVFLLLNIHSSTNTVLALSWGASYRWVQFLTRFFGISWDSIFSVWGQKERLCQPLFLTLHSVHIIDGKSWIASFLNSIHLGAKNDWCMVWTTVFQRYRSQKNSCFPSQLPLLSFTLHSVERTGGWIIFYFCLWRGLKTVKELQLKKKITEG